MTPDERVDGRVPAEEDIEEIARRTLERLPEPFAASLGDIVLRVEAVADRETARSADLDDPMQLSGLYQGVPLHLRSSTDPAQFPEQITLYSRPILAEWQATNVSLAELVSHIVIHEVGHHFGFSDDDMHAIEDGAE